MNIVDYKVATPNSWITNADVTTVRNGGIFDAASPMGNVAASYFVLYT
jgi:hypothetical protein